MAHYIMSSSKTPFDNNIDPTNETLLDYLFLNRPLHIHKKISYINIVLILNGKQTESDHES